MSRRLLINLVLSVLLAALFMYLAFRNVPFDELRAALQRFDWRWLFPAVALSALLMLARAWRWQLELRPLADIPLGRLWVVTAIAYMAINLLPVRLGEVVRPWLLSRRSHVNMSNVVGNLVVEKVIDAFCVVFYILIGLLTTRDLPSWVRRGAIFPAVAALALGALVAVVWFKGEAFIDGPLRKILPVGFAERLKHIVAAILDGMRILPNGRLVCAVFAISMGLWFLPILSSWVIIQAFGFAVPFNAALIVFIFIGFGTALPNAPGWIGAFQYACILALGIFGVGKTDALAFGLVLNAIQLVTITLQGILALPFAGVSAEDFRRARKELAQA